MVRHKPGGAEASLQCLHLRSWSWTFIFVPWFGLILGIWQTDCKARTRSLFLILFCFLLLKFKRYYIFIVENLEGTNNYRENRVIVLKCKSRHVPLLLKTLQWFLLIPRIKSKLLLAYRVLHFGRFYYIFNAFLYCYNYHFIRTLHCP